MTRDSESIFREWAILELLGHRRMAGLVTEAQIAGASFLRIDVPGPGGEFGSTQFYAPGSVYAITPTTEEIARRVAVGAQPAPVSRWELPAPEPERTPTEPKRMPTLDDQEDRDYHDDDDWG